MMNGHWYSTSSVSRSSRWLGSPSLALPTVVFVSSERRIDRLMSARGQSTFHDPPWLSPPKLPLKTMRQNWNEPSTSSGVESRTFPKPRLNPRRPNCASAVVAAATRTARISTLAMGRRRTNRMAPVYLFPRCPSPDIRIASASVVIQRTEMARVFITGGTGYVGRRLVRALLELGHDVRVLTRPGSESRVPSGASAVVGDAL